MISIWFSREKRQELAPVTGDLVQVIERARILPVAETDSVVVGTPAEVEDYTQDNQAKRSKHDA